MHIHYKFGLFLIFILSLSACYTRAAPTSATNQSTTNGDDNYHDDYDDDYYDELEGGTTTEANRLMTTVDTMTTVEVTTTPKSAINQFSKIDLPPKRSNHVLEPACPKACRCLEDYKYVQCTNAGLTHVPHDMPNTALIIDLSQNNITELHASDFANCTKVREINLSDNQLTKLNEEVFTNLRRLQRLRVANNRLTRINPNTFSNITSLSHIDLSNNTIELHSDGSFLNQPELLELSCRNCSWTQVFDNTFANLSSLTSLKLDFNDFQKKINTKAFTPLRNLIKLKLPELDQASVQELCNLLKAIDNISFKHFDVSCFELVLGTSFNESLILMTDSPPHKQQATTNTSDKNTGTKKVNQRKLPQNMTENGVDEQQQSFVNFTLPANENSNIDDNDAATATNMTILTAGMAGVGNAVNATITNGTAGGSGKNDEKSYQVPVSPELINIMLISIIIIAAIGIVIGVICRKDVGGVKTKCCRTRKPDPKDQIHPAEEIPLNKLS